MAPAYHWGWRGGGGVRKAQNGSSGPLATSATWLIPLHTVTSKRNEIKNKRGVMVTKLLNTRTR